MTTDKRITHMSVEYRKRNRNNLPVTSTLKQLLVRIIVFNKRNNELH